ncbi:MAG: serine hydrolase [Acidobacteria bacterium]|nr:serine hydrolase [Acidobacteriota bacterium]
MLNRALPALIAFPLLAQAPAVPADFDALVARTMKAFEVPGLSVTVVKDGKVALAKGYGVRKLGSAEPVDAHTLFGIASNSKAFTAASVAILVDEGKLAWDDPVIKHLPGFKLADPYVTRELTIRDLLSHRSGLGLGAGDLMYWPDTTFTREKVLAGAAHLKPASSLRSRYAYNNLGFVVVGEIVGKVAGMPWEAFVAERLLKPLGMTETHISSDGIPDSANVAFPHAKGWRQDRPLAPTARTRDQVWAAAAGLKSNLPDLAKWVTCLLEKGKLPDGKPLISPKALHEMWSLQIPLRTPVNPTAGMEEATPQFSGYGLGWSLRDYAGHKVVSHTGGLTGMVTTVVMVPDQKLGLVVLTNQEQGDAFNALVYSLLDHALGRPPKDWTALLRKRHADRLAENQKALKEAEAKRDKASRPSLPLERYAGTYHDAWYGDVVIAQEGGKLAIRLTPTSVAVGELQPWQQDTFRAVFQDPDFPDAYLTFRLNAAGAIESIKMVPTSDLADFSFDYQDLDLRPVKGK